MPQHYIAKKCMSSPLYHSHNCTLVMAPSSEYDYEF